MHNSQMKVEEFAGIPRKLFRVNLYQNSWEFSWSWEFLAFDGKMNIYKFPRILRNSQELSEINLKHKYHKI